ncbi:unnamed protein product [Jaminaea pallidilutea]
MASSPRKRHLLPASDVSASRSPPWLVTFVALLLVRLTGAAYALISDCDETFNYWEALHLVLFGGRPVQTWEYSPEFAIRSWAYILAHAPAGLVAKLAGFSKLSTFYITRAALAVTSASIETHFTSTVARVVSPRCAWILLSFLAANAGLFSASVALLPSSFTFYTTTLALSFAMEPAVSPDFPASPHLPAPRSPAPRSPAPRSPAPRSPASRPNRTLKATLAFALGALLAWPFALVLSLPFVFDELFFYSGNVLRPQRWSQLVTTRATAFIKAALYASLLAVPILTIDTLFYGKLALVPWNIITYNVLSAQRGAGPELYGTEPAWFYLANLGLNVGPIILVLALMTAPVLILDRLTSTSRYSDPSSKEAQGSSRLSLLLLRTAPFYVWLGLLSTQPHKEERFMFPAYASLCFNAALSLDTIMIIAQQVMSHSRQRNTASVWPTHLLATPVILCSAAFAILRICGTIASFHAPFTVLHHLNNKSADIHASPNRGLSICYGKEWYRFPSSFFLPDNDSLEFVKSAFDGILPKHFYDEGNDLVNSDEKDAVATAMDALLGWTVPDHLASRTRAWQTGFNDLNREEPDRYVNVTTQCHLLVDSGDLSPTVPASEPRYVDDTSHWHRLRCEPFLDAEASKQSAVGQSLAFKLAQTVARTLWAPAEVRRRLGLRYRDYCLLANRNLP